LIDPSNVRLADAKEIHPMARKGSKEDRFNQNPEQVASFGAATLLLPRGARGMFSSTHPPRDLAAPKRLVPPT
jgi:hypothetical protein